MKVPMSDHTVLGSPYMHMLTMTYAYAKVCVSNGNSICLFKFVNWFRCYVCGFPVTYGVMHFFYRVRFSLFKRLYYLINFSNNTIIMELPYFHIPEGMYVSIF